MDAELNRPHQWQGRTKVKAFPYVCGYCSNRVAPGEGYIASTNGKVFICSNCEFPTFIGVDADGSSTLQVPGSLPGAPVDNLPDLVEPLYNEARRCYSVGAFTATAMACRKILMNVAVQEGAEPNLRFVQYVNFLDENHHVPPKGRNWVEHIKEKGNEANHEIRLVLEPDARQLLLFTQLFLTFVYTFADWEPS
jgi:hypothetical protein